MPKGKSPILPPMRFTVRRSDRILLNGLIQPFQQPERVLGFFSTYRHLYPFSPFLEAPGS